MMNDVQLMQDVKPLSSVQLMNDVTGLQDVTPLTFNPPTQYVAPLRVKQYYPEISNSLLDVVLSPQGNENLLKKYGFSKKLGWAVPFVALLHVYDSYIDPLVRHGLTSGQGWKEVGLNTLQEVGEDLDVFSNIIKSQFDMAGGTAGAEGLRGALGLDGYRKTYNFNTGNTVADIILEFVSDPINWFTLGGKGVAESATETAAKEVSETVTKELVATATKEIAEETAEQVGKEAVKQLSEKALKELSKKITKLVFEYGDDITYDILIKHLTKETVEELLETNLKELTPKLIKQLIDSRAYRWFKGATAIKQGADLIDKKLATIAWGVTPAGLPAKYIVKPLAKKAFGHLYNLIVDHLKRYDLLHHFIKKKEAYQEALETAMIKNQAIHETVFKNANELLKEAGLDSYKIQQIVYTVLKEAEKTGEEINLYKAVLNYVSENYDIAWKISRKNSALYKELIDTAVIAPAAMLQIEKELNQSYNIASIKSMQKYINKEKELEKILKYIDENALTLNDKHFGLYNLEGFLNELFLTRGITSGYKMELAQLLETVGIRLDNAAEIADILNSNVANKSEALQAIIEKAKGTYLLTQQDYQKMYDKVSKQINKDTGSYLNKVWKNNLATHNIETYENIMAESFKNIDEAVSNIEQELPFKIDDTEFKGIDVEYVSFGKENNNIAVYNKDNNRIKIDKERLEKSYKNKIWKNRTPSVIATKDFSSIEDYAQFVMLHEYAHSYIRPEQIIPEIDLAEFYKLPYSDPIRIQYEVAIDAEAKRLLDIAQHPIDYVRNVVRSKDVPNSEELTNLITRLKENTKSRNIKRQITSYMKNIETTLKQTDYIINKLDKSLDTAFEIKSWYANLDEAIKNMGELLDTLDKAGPYGVEPHVKLLEIKTALMSFKRQAFTDSLTNYIDNVDGMVISQLSHLGMFNVIIQNTHLAEDPSVATFLAQLSDKTSITRKNFDILVNAFNAADMPDIANQMNKVLAQIQTVNNLNTLLTTELKTPFKLNKQTQTDILRILFDSIENHKTYLIADILTDELTDPTQWALAPLKYSEVDKITLEPLKDVTQKTYRQTILDEVSSRIQNSKQIMGRILGDTAELDISIDDILESINTQVSVVLKDYINAQAELSTLVDNIALSTLYDTNTIDILDLSTKLKYDLFRNTPNPSAELVSVYNTFSREFYEFANKLQLSINQIADINKKLAIPLHRYDATQLLKQISESYNLYSASIESGMYTTKYLIENSYDFDGGHHVGFIEQFNLRPENIKGTQDEYLMVADKLWGYRDILHEKYKYEDKYIQRLRKCLIETYSAPNALFAPKDPMLYFNSLNKQELLTWETVTKGNLSLNNKTRFYAAYKKYTQELDIERYTVSDFIGAIEARTRNNGFINDYDIAEMATTARKVNAIEYANRIIDANLMQTLHSLDDLGKYKADIVKFLQDDVSAMDDIIKTLHEIDNDSSLRMYYNDFGNPEDLKNLGGSEYGYVENTMYNQQMMYSERKSTMAISIANMDAEELATHIYRQTPGAMVFHNDKIIKVQHVDGSVTWEPINEQTFGKKLFNFTKEELNSAGLKIKKVTDENGEWYLIRLTNKNQHIKIPTYNALPDTHRRLQTRYSDIINKYRLYLNMYELEDIPDNLITVEALNEDTWNMFMDKYSDFFGDFEERKMYQKYTPRGTSEFFDKSFSRANFTVIGGYDTYNIWNKINPTYIPRSILLSQNTLTGLTAAVNRSNKINKYLTLFFNEDWSLDNPLLTKMFEGADDKRIREFFKEGKYKVAVLRSDRKGLPRVWEYNVSNRHTLDKAIAAGGILVPVETFGAMRQVVNNRKMTNSLLDIYRRVVPSTYKSMYLYTLGFPFRNFIDSMLYKNMNELGGLTEAGDTIKYEIQASKAIELHNKLQEEMLAETGGETLNKKVILNVLSRHTQEEAEVYYLTDIFMQSNASGGFSESLGSWLENYNKIQSDDIRPIWEKIYEDDFLFAHTKTYPWTPQIKAHPYNPLARLRELNSHIEDTARLGLFLASVDAGMPINDAIARVVKTHFDYSTGGDMMDICERIFWFSTFPINNFNYYVDGGLTKSPSLLRLVMDTQTASWNNGEYTYEELKKTNFLAYHALTGNIRIGNWIIKTSPSLFDFIGLMTDPIGNIKDRLNPFISIATGDTDNVLEDLNPLQTQFRLFPKQFQGNPIPSILSKINDYNWTPTLGKWRTSTKKPKSKWTSYPKIKKPRHTNSYVRHYYSRRYYTGVRKLTRTSLYQDLPRYYRLGGRKGTTYRDL